MKTKGAPTRADLLIGERLRAARVAEGLSQSTLAGSVGITFQQLQKYENGKNRIAASRLMQFAVTLGRPIEWFFEPVQEAALAGEMGAAVPENEIPPAPKDERKIYKTGKIICDIPNPNIQRHLLAIAREVSPGKEQRPD
jgi:transcriptional regulator with XRE-family HTH domain